MIEWDWLSCAFRLVRRQKILKYKYQRSYSVSVFSRFIIKNIKNIILIWWFPFRRQNVYIEFSPFLVQLTIILIFYTKNKIRSINYGDVYINWVLHIFKIRSIYGKENHDFKHLVPWGHIQIRKRQNPNRKSGVASRWRLVVNIDNLPATPAAKLTLYVIHIHFDVVRTA